MSQHAKIKLHEYPPEMKDLQLKNEWERKNEIERIIQFEMDKKNRENKERLVISDYIISG